MTKLTLSAFYEIFEALEINWFFSQSFRDESKHTKKVKANPLVYTLDRNTL